MNGTVRKWFDKAEGDYGVAERELHAGERPNYDAAGWHDHPGAPGRGDGDETRDAVICRWAEPTLRSFEIPAEALNLS